MRAGGSQVGKASAAENKPFYSLKLVCTFPWIFIAQMSLNLAAPLHGWHGSKIHTKLPEGSGRRGYEAMQGYTLIDDQGFLLWPHTLQIHTL